MSDPPAPGPSRDVEVVCSGVGHRFGRQQLFSDIHLTLTRGASVCVAGPNGSGKSTLLRILAGLLEPASGTVQWRAHGQVLKGAQQFRSLGWVSPDVQLYQELTVLENVSFFARLRNIPGHADHWTAYLESFALAPERNKYYAALSSGLKQRARLACALLHEPRALFLDEPTSNLDRTGKELVARLIEAQIARGLLIMATNEEEEYRFGRLVRLG